MNCSLCICVFAKNTSSQHKGINSNIWVSNSSLVTTSLLTSTGHCKSQHDSDKNNMFGHLCNLFSHWCSLWPHTNIKKKPQSTHVTFSIYTVNAAWNTILKHFLRNARPLHSLSGTQMVQCSTLPWGKLKFPNTSTPCAFFAFIWQWKPLTSLH